MNTNDKFNEFINKLPGRLRIPPPLRMSIHALIRAFADENLTTKQLALIIYQYPVISARLLGLANSDWIRPASSITDIETACVRLGQATVKSVSLALTIASSFDTRRCPSFDPIRFWVTSMLVAEGGALLATKLPHNSKDAHNLIVTVKTAGILHNLGLLWLADNMDLETERALKLSLSNPSLGINQILADQTGVDYCQAGAWILKQWGVPNELITVVAHHRDKQNTATTSIPVLLIAAAANMVSAVFHECHEIIENTSLSQLGIDFSVQNSVFNHLANELDSTKELAKTLFV